MNRGARALVRGIPRASRVNIRNKAFVPCVSQIIGHIVAPPATRARNLSTEAEAEHSFQAETRQLLDIVTHNIYTDKEVFLRELISNASDALEKLRHRQATGAPISDPDSELEINISIDKDAKTLTISDTGIGLSREEMSENLGTIARSGSKAFVNEVSTNTESAEAASSIIGKFGVGFYSSFMVGEEVEVSSKSADPDHEATVWRSRGTGSYTLKPASTSQSRGCTVVIHLKDSELEYLDPRRVTDLVTKHSNFVNFPIKIDGEVVNTVQAIWTSTPSEVTDDQYKEFYQFISRAFDEPSYHLHFRSDAPIDLKALLFIPTLHSEMWGQSRMQPGVSLYSRKVLIEKDSETLLPEWLRFLKGVVDSEDLPLSLSREKPQDSRLLARIQQAIVKRVIRFLNREATNDPKKFQDWFKNFGNFIKEGIVHDSANQADLAKLLYFDSSTTETTTLDEYISRCTPEQQEIYYLAAPSKALAEASPYYETFKRNDKEVLFVYTALDEFVLTNLGSFNNRKLVSAESKELDLADDDQPSTAEGSLSAEEATALGVWMKAALPEKLSEVAVTKRLADSPAIITDHESGSLRKMMRFVEQKHGQLGGMALEPQRLEINPKHPIILGLNKLREDENQEATAKLILEQMVDNAVMTAGLMDDGREMVSRVNLLLEKLVEKSK